MGVPIINRLCHGGGTMIKDAQLEGIFDELYREWEIDLQPDEQEIWLWNAMVEIKKIKQRRESFQEFVKFCQG